MRPRTRLHALLLSLLTALVIFPTQALAAEDEQGDEYEETARVVRVSMTKGEVSLRRAGEIEWERAQLNLPLVEGDVLATGRDSIVEIQADARNFVRVGANSVVKVVTLRDEGVALSLSEGTASVRLARFDRDKEYFEVDAPGTTVSAEKQGLYRVDVAEDGRVRVTVRDDGRARVYSESSGFVLRNNKTAVFFRDAQGEGDWDFTDAASLDEWDRWNGERERHLAALLRHESRDRYYDREVWGAEELDAYGDWTHTREYGYLWRPHVTVINNYPDWAPYRHGHWRWVPPYGWTWIPDEPWGWAPYHYGRWVYHNNNWCWAPRGYGYAYRRAWWRPALVVFVNVNTSRGRHIAWYPLRHGERDPRGRHWQRQRPHDRTPSVGGRRGMRNAADAAAVFRSVTSVHAGEFGIAAVRAKAAPVDVAERALTTEPVSGRLPVEPSNRGRSRAPEGVTRTKSADARATGANERPTLDINRPADVGPTRPVLERKTGAASRTPGLPLDSELRRTRVFAGREPRVAQPNVGNVISRGDEDTGAVSRPAPAVRRKPVEGAGGNTREDDNNNGSLPAKRDRPTRPDSVDGNSDGNNDGSARPRARPTRPTETTPNDRPTFDSPVEPRIRRKPEPEVNSQPEPRRDDTPVVRPERTAPREERPAPPPTRTKERPPDAPRYEPPPRREEPRHQPPPRQEQPRNDPPPRQEQPKQERPRPESPRQERSSPPPSPVRNKSKSADDPHR